MAWDAVEAHVPSLWSPKLFWPDQKLKKQIFATVWLSRSKATVRQFALCNHNVAWHQLHLMQSHSYQQWALSNLLHKELLNSPHHCMMMLLSSNKRPPTRWKQWSLHRMTTEKPSTHDSLYTKIVGKKNSLALCKHCYGRSNCAGSWLIIVYGRSKRRSWLLPHNNTN